MGSRLLALALLAATVVGCSSDETSDETASWTQRAEQICREATRDASKLPQDLGTDEQAAGRTREREILDEKLAGLRELDVPANSAEDVERLIRLSTQAAVVHERFLRAAGDASDPQARADSVRLLKEQKRLGERSEEIARQLDLGHCAPG